MSLWEEVPITVKYWEGVEEPIPTLALLTVKRLLMVVVAEIVVVPVTDRVSSMITEPRLDAERVKLRLSEG